MAEVVVSKYILLAQNIVIYLLMIQMGWVAFRKLRQAKTLVFKRIMRGLIGISLFVFLGVSTTTITLLVRNRLPSFGELIFFEAFVFILIYVWGVLNPRSLDEGLEKP